MVCLTYRDGRRFFFQCPRIKGPSPCGPAVPCLTNAVPWSFCSLVFGLGRIFPDRRQEGVASIRSRNLAVQNRLKRYHFPVEKLGGILILVYKRTRQIDAREKT